MSNKLHIETWNGKTLLRPGKMQELAEELMKTQVQIVAIQEVRWQGTGLQDYKEDLRADGMTVLNKTSVK
jgi:nitrogen regulatory protein PII